MDDLKAQAEALGIRVDGRWSEATLSHVIAEESNKFQINAPKRIKNVSGRRWVAFNTVLNPEEEYTPTDADMSHDKYLARVNRAVLMGKLEWIG